MLEQLKSSILLFSEILTTAFFPVAASFPSTASARAPVQALLHRWLARHASEEGGNWLVEQEQRIAAGAARRFFFTSFSAAPRYVGKADLALSAEDQAAAEAARTGWQPAHWSADQLARTLLVLALPADDAERYQETLDLVFSAADVGEGVALHQSVPLLPHPERHLERAREGTRSNMTSVFEAVALRNPYPAEQFGENAWNQVVLKAVFVDSALHAIYGLDRRANARLARILREYAHERWAAGRAVTPELWRPVGPFATGAALEDLERVLRHDDPARQAAGALALAASPDPGADALLGTRPDLQDRIAGGELTWEALSANRDT